MIELLGTYNWKNWRNTGSVTIGPYQVFEITGNEVLDGESYRLGRQPTSTPAALYGVNGPFPCEPGYRGVYQPGPEVIVAYDTGTPACGEVWKPKASQGTLSKTGTGNWGVTVQGIGDSTAKKLCGVIMPGVTVQGIGKLTASLSQGGHATFEPWTVSGGTFSDTGNADETVYDWLMKAGATALASGKKIVYVKIGDTNVLTEAECP